MKEYQWLKDEIEQENELEFAELLATHGPYGACIITRAIVCTACGACLTDPKSDDDTIMECNQQHADCLSTCPHANECPF